LDRRSYNQYCGLARALDVVGERWTLLVVRNLLLGPLRYSELLRGLPGITTNLLAKRLREMEELELIERVRSGMAEGHAYRLTSTGAALEPAVHALARWGWRSLPEDRPGKHRSFDWLMVALRRRYLGGETLRAELIADEVPYRVLLSDSAVEIARGEAPSPDVRIRGAAAALARMFMDSRTRNRIPAGVEMEGKPEDVKRLMRSFATQELA
jgi:DNA-binding HxlR family transcriptional regulator